MDPGGIRAVAVELSGQSIPPMWNPIYMYFSTVLDTGTEFGKVPNSGPNCDHLSGIWVMWRTAGSGSDNG